MNTNEKKKGVPTMRLRDYILAVILLLLAVSYLLCACGGTEQADAQTEPRGKAAAAMPDDEKAGEVPTESGAAPVEKAAPPLSVSEAADGLFFSCRNMHYDFLQELEGAIFDFYILSEEPLRPEEISIDTGLEAQGRTDITELKLAGTGDPMNGGTVPDGFTVPNEVLLSEQIGDWGRIRELEARYASAETDSDRADCIEALRAITGEIWSAMVGKAGQDHAVRDFHAYKVTVHLTAYTGKIETTEAITVRIKDRSYKVDCGSVTVYSLHTISELQHADSDVLMNIKSVLSTGGEPCAGGWITTGMTSMFGFLARDNVTLTGLSLFEEDSGRTGLCSSRTM